VRAKKKKSEYSARKCLLGSKLLAVSKKPRLCAALIAIQEEKQKRNGRVGQTQLAARQAPIFFLNVVHFSQARRKLADEKSPTP